MNQIARKMVFILLLSLCLLSITAGIAFAAGHTHNGITFNEWSSGTSLPSSAGNYYLTKDVSLSSTWYVPSGTTSLCLNGHTIRFSNKEVKIKVDGGTFNLYDENNVGKITGGKSTGTSNNHGGGVYIKKGTFNMYGGTITGNEAGDHGGGVAVGMNNEDDRHKAFFNMYGGVISANKSNWGGGISIYGTAKIYSGTISDNSGTSGGGGIELESDGKLYLSGGTITGNRVTTSSANMWKGGGVHVPGGSYCYIQGSPIITDNYKGSSGSTANNVFLRSGLTLTVNGALSSDARMGISTQNTPTKNNPVTITSGLKTNQGNLDPFTSDDTTYSVLWNSNSTEACVGFPAQTVYLIKQNVDGTWTNTPSRTVNISASTYSVPSADNGFTVAGYTLGAYQAESSRTTTYANTTINLGSSNALYIYYARNRYSLLFYEDQAGEKVWKTENVYFGADLSGYAPSVNGQGSWNGNYQLSSKNSELYTFGGWSTKAGETVYSTDGVTSCASLLNWQSQMPAETVRVYPIWVANYVHVVLDLGAWDEYNEYTKGKYDLNSPAVMDSTQSRSFWKSTNITAASPDRDKYVDMTKMKAATRTGYQLDGWFTSNGLRWDSNYIIAREYGDRDSSGNLILNYDAPYRNYTYVLTLTARWILNNAKIEYDAGPGSGGPVPDNTDYALNSTITISDVVPTHEDSTYKFMGWQDKNGEMHKSGETFIYSSAALVNTPGNPNLIKLTAVYVKVLSGSLIFDSQGGTVIAPITVSAGSTIPIANIQAKIPERIGYTFGGWYTDSACSTNNMVTSDITIQSGGMTIYAKWNPNTYTITFKTNGGTQIASITKEYGTAVTPPSNPTRTGYEFDKWDKEIPNKMPAENITITASWKVKSYAIKYDTDGGSGIPDTTAHYGEVVTEPEAIPTRDGYTFSRWLITWNDGILTSPFNMPDGEVTFKSIWKANQKQTVTVPNASAVTDTTVTIDGTVNGQEYIILPKGVSPSDQDWNQSVPGNGKTITFSELEPNTEYNVYTRIPGNETKMPSEPAGPLTVQTQKSDQTVPNPPTVSAVSPYAVEVVHAVEMAEYVVVLTNVVPGDDDWNRAVSLEDGTENILITGLKPYTAYKVYVRMQGTPTQKPSKAVSSEVRTFKANVEIIPPVANHLIYNGKPQPLVTAGYTLDDETTLWYAVTTDLTAPADSDYSEEIPEAVDAGTYYVWYMVMGYGNFKNMDPVLVKIEHLYTFIKGADGIWQKFSGMTLYFEISDSIGSGREYYQFSEIKIDETPVGRGEYTTDIGSIILGLKPTFLETLSIGKHTLTAIFKDGHTDTTFTVTPPDEVKPDDLPVTGDNSLHPAVYGLIAALSILIIVFMIRRKR